MFSYGQIEKALAALHHFDTDASLKTFRSRIKHFQRIGVVPSAPGKGQKLSYIIADVVYWALCFELVELGLPPSLAKSVMEIAGYRLVTFFTGYALQEDAFYFMMAGSFMSWQLSKEGDLLSGKCGLAIGKQNDLNKSLKHTSRMLIIDLTKLKTDLGKQLGHSWTDDKSAWDPPNFGRAKPVAGDWAGPDPAYR